MERQLGKSTLEDDARRLLTWIRQEAGGLTHNIRSATHPDTIAGVVTRGQLLVGESTPKWTGLALGAAYTHLESDGTDLAYQANLTMADDAWIGLGAAAGRIVFDSTAAPDQVQLAAADLYLPASHGIIHADGVTAGYVLRADGTRYIPADPTTNLPLAPVAQGDILIADGTPAWSILTLGAAAGYALVSTATSAEWDQTPMWTGDHTWDDGSGDSPAIKFVGGSNDDTISIFLDDDATANDSDLIIRLCATDDDSRVRIQDSSPSTVTYFDADGNADFSGHVAVGGAASVASGTLCYVTESVTSTSGNQIGVDSIMVAAPTSNFTSSFYAVIGQAKLDSDSTQTSGSIVGVYGQAVIDQGHTGTANDLIAGLFWPDAEDGTATSSRGMMVYTPNVDTGTVTTGYGVSVVQGTVGGSGTLTTLYGLHMANINAGTTNYAIYTNAGECRFGDDVDISGVLTLQQESEPSDPSEGAGVMWCSNGTGAGDPGDLMWKATESSVTKTDTLVDFSEL